MIAFVMVRASVLVRWSLFVWALAGIAAYAGVLAGETAAARAALTPAAEARSRRCNSHGFGFLPAHAIKGGVPLKVSHAHPLHYDVMARRDGRCISYGLAPRNYCLDYCSLTPRIY